MLPNFASHGAGNKRRCYRAQVYKTENYEVTSVLGLGTRYLIVSQSTVIIGSRVFLLLFYCLLWSIGFLLRICTCAKYN